MIVTQTPLQHFRKHQRSSQDGLSWIIVPAMFHQATLSFAELQLIKFPEMRSIVESGTMDALCLPPWQSSLHRRIGQRCQIIFSCIPIASISRNISWFHLAPMNDVARSVAKNQ